MCDRCGEIFDPNNLQEVKIGDRNFKKMKPIIGSTPTPKPCDNGNGTWTVSDFVWPTTNDDEFYWDLCNSCLRDFQRWWAVPKTEKKGEQMGFIKFIFALFLMAIFYPHEVDVLVFAILLAGFIAYGGWHREG